MNSLLLLLAVFMAGTPLLAPLAIGALGFRALSERSWGMWATWIYALLASIIFALATWHLFGGQTTVEMETYALPLWIAASGVGGIAAGALFAATAKVLGRAGWLVSGALALPVILIHGMFSGALLLSLSGFA